MIRIIIKMKMREMFEKCYFLILLMLMCVNVHIYIDDGITCDSVVNEREC